MKKKTIAILVALMLFGGCGAQPSAAPVDPSTAADMPDMETIIQQSVDEAVQQKMKEYEEELQKKNQEIDQLKDQLEDLTGQSEDPPEPTGEEPSAPESQLEETPSEPELPPQPEPESAPVPEKSVPSPSSNPVSSYDGFDLKNLYPSYVFENNQGGGESDGDPEYDSNETKETGEGYFRLEDAEEVIRLTNKERENHGLDPLPMDEDLMELARIRAMEIKEKYSHTRPDGTTVGDLRCGENCGQRSSAAEQVNSWMNSEGHRTNILLDRYHHIGVGCYQAPNGNLYWVEVFSLD